MLCALCNKSNDKGSEDSQLSYRQQVIRALVQRYIESARREFEEAKRKGNADTGANQTVTQKKILDNFYLNIQYATFFLRYMLQYNIILI